MPDDAMVWHPTTPPAQHNPYVHPQYMPGGWPASPPAFRYTTGVFARKRKADFIERAVKRVCMGIWTLGTYTITIPVKPVYLIVRRCRRRQSEERRREEKSPIQLRRKALGARAQSAAAEHSNTSQTQLSPAQPENPPTTFSTYAKEVASPSIVSSEQAVIQTPSANSVTDTETTVPTPSSIRNTTGRVVDHLGKLQTRKRRNPRISERGHLDYLYEDHLATTDRARQRTSEADLSPPSKKMKGSNHFDAGYRHSPTAYGGRGARNNVHIKSIGAKVENPQGIEKLFGGWEFEKPIELTPPHSPTPSEQMQSELDSHISEHDTPNKVEEEIPESNEARASALLTDEFDQRWDSVGPAEKYWPGEYFVMTEEEIEEERKASLVPPPIKPRLVPSDRSTKPAPGSVNESEVLPDGATDKNNSIEFTENGDVYKPEGTSTSTASVPPESSVSIVDKPSIIEKEILESVEENQPAPVPHTPMKVVAEKPANEDSKALDQNTLQVGFETPAEKLSKLRIKDETDSDTPKATPHSGTKTTRITRYREAIEKAQKAKLEQYELVAVSDEWRNKVRQAARSGIPDYLGPHDLARVVPQYASRGQDNWLNDETINKYLEIVATHGRKNDRPEQVRSHHTFNNFFYNNLRSKGPESVSKWSKRAKIGGKNLAYVEKIFVPINSGAHWTLAVVEPTQKRITHYNSMRGSATGVRACEDLKQWVAAEQGKDFKEEEWTFAVMGESPQQTNSDDCGVFTITSARQIMLGYTPMSYGAAQIPEQRVRIVAELVNKGLLRSSIEV